MAGLQGGQRKLGAQIAGEAGRGEGGRRRAVAAGERLLIERLGEDRLEGGVAVTAGEARADTRGAGAGDREALKVADDLLHGARLGEHVVGGEDLADVRPDLGGELLGARLPVALAAMAEIAALGREVRLLRAAAARGDALMRCDAGVGRVDRERGRGGADEDALADEPPRHRVERAPDADVRIGVDARRVPDRRDVGRHRERAQRGLLDGGEDLEGTPLRRAVPPLAGDLAGPPGELTAEDAGVELGATRGEEIPLHVLARRLDLALLLRAADGRRVDLEAVVARALAVTAVEGRRTRDTERGADDGRLEIVRH